MVSGCYRMYKERTIFICHSGYVKRAKRDKTIREELFADVVAAFKRILAEKLSDTRTWLTGINLCKSVAFDDALIKAAELKEGRLSGRDGNHG